MERKDVQGEDWILTQTAELAAKLVSPAGKMRFEEILQIVSARIALHACVDAYLASTDEEEKRQLYERGMELAEKLECDKRDYDAAILLRRKGWRWELI